MERAQLLMAIVQKKISTWSISTMIDAQGVQTIQGPVVSRTNYQVVPYGWNSRRKGRRDNETRVTNLNKINNWDTTRKEHTIATNFVANALEELKEEMRQVKETQANYWHLYNIMLNGARWSSKKRERTTLTSLLFLFYLNFSSRDCQVVHSLHLMLPLSTKLRQCSPSLPRSQSDNQLKGSSR